LAAELVGLSVDVIVTRGTPSALAAKKATDTIPVVMAAIGEPFSVVTSLARPGGNITGLSAFVVDLMPKRVELVRDMIPGLARVAIVLNLSNPIHATEWEHTRVAAASMGIHCELFDVRRREDLVSAFDAAREQRAQSLVIGLDTLTQTNRELITELAARHRLPAIYASREFVDAGGLITYGVSYPDLYRRAASYVDKLLKGAKPASLPVEQPARFELVINLRTAKALALEIPQQLLARADAVIE
jgi:putative ABC transport system substrate-binding protein